MIEFKDDGTLVMGRGGVSYSMDYEKQDPDIILFKGSVDGSIPDQRMTYKVEDDHLILSIDGSTRFSIGRSRRQPCCLPQF